MTIGILPLRIFLLSTIWNFVKVELQRDGLSMKKQVDTNITTVNSQAVCYRNKYKVDPKRFTVHIIISGIKNKNVLLNEVFLLPCFNKKYQ